jgi:hypothetical protein
MRALRFLLCQHRQNFGGERFILFVLGHSETRKISHGTEYRNRDENLDHVPTSASAANSTRSNRHIERMDQRHM